MNAAVENVVAITGNTYPVKEALTAIGARWDDYLKAWMISPDKADRAREIVAGAGPKAAFAGRSSYAGRETKRCWECGGSFTYSDAKRNGGDWSDSYCGC